MSNPVRYHPLIRVEQHHSVHGEGPLVAPEVELRPDLGHTVDGMQLRPDTRTTVAVWAAPVAELVSGGLLLLDGNTVLGRVELGDHVIRRVDGTRAAESADGFAARYVPVGTETRSR